MDLLQSGSAFHLQRAAAGTRRTDSSVARTRFDSEPTQDTRTLASLGSASSVAAFERCRRGLGTASDPRRLRGRFVAAGCTRVSSDRTF